jgi:5'-methylthioadenosine phosphorylase
MRVDVAVIGGTGVGDRLAALGGMPLHVPTRFGLARGRLVEHEASRIFVLQRHGAGHKVIPHRINYRAMAEAVRQLGAKACFSTAATGGLREDWPCGTMAVCHDFVDVSGRNATLYEREVAHTDFSHPFAHRAREALLAGAADENVPVQKEAVYVMGNGPRYETPFEIRLYRRMGGDVVGMTAATEAILMGEAGVAYGCLAVVTNFACGLAGVPLSHEEVVDEMQRSGDKAVRILLAASRHISRKP